jgi:hypothetical protein
LTILIPVFDPIFTTHGIEVVSDALGILISEGVVEHQFDLYIDVHIQQFNRAGENEHRIRHNLAELLLQGLEPISSRVRSIYIHEDLDCFDVTTFANSMYVTFHRLVNVSLSYLSISFSDQTQASFRSPTSPRSVVMVLRYFNGCSTLAGNCITARPSLETH